MNPLKRKILVPYDYSELSEFAVKHAVQISKITESDIILLHVVPELSEELEDSKKLQAVATSFNEKYGCNIEIIIRAGKIHKVIKLVAEMLNVILVVMKTQKPRRKERYLGSRTIRVMIGSRIPFFVVQAPPKRLGFRKVIFPIDFRKENKEKLVWISFLSKYYTSKIYLLRPDATDYNIRNNLDFAIRFLEGKSIDYEIITAKNKYSASEETIEFANKVQAEMIIIMLTRNLTFAKIMLGLKEQSYISNKYKIPVMCLNPRTDLRKLEGFN